jgi:hypothetical protein
MIAFHSLFSRRAACAFATLGSTLALAAASPAEAQQERPVVRHSHPLVRLDRRHTRVTFDFTLPRGYQLLDNPRVRIVSARGELVVLAPAKVTNRGPNGSGYRRLNTEDYPSGTHRIQVEIDYLDPEGKKGTVSSPPAPLIVPKR